MRLNVTAIGEFIRHRSCERRLLLASLGEPRLNADLPFFSRLATVALDPVLREEGRRRENAWEQSLVERGFVSLSTADVTSWSDFARAAEALDSGQNAYCRELAVDAQVGAFELEGRVDFALLTWHGDRPIIRLVECKASRRDQTYHRIQVAAYRLLLGELLRRRPLCVAGRTIADGDIEACVARIEEESNTSQDMLLIPPIDSESLTLLQIDVERLLALDGPFQRILNSDLDALPYQLDERCNDCFFAIHCFTESARLRRLELLGLSPAEVRGLASSGVGDLDDLAALKLTDPQTAGIRHLPGFSLDLEALIARAGVRLACLPGAGPSARQVMPIRPASMSLLPEHEQESGRLLRVYLAVDYDYSENRLGAMSAHVTFSDARLSTSFDPKTKEVRLMEGRFAEGRYDSRPLSSKWSCDVVAIVPRPGWSGDFAADCLLEREAIEDFFSRLLDVVEQVAQGASDVPMHFYAWEQSDIRALVDACLRLDPDGEGPLRSLRNLLSSRGHEEQVIFSALGEEMRRRFASGFTGTGPLVAAQLDWARKDTYKDLFRWQRRLGGQSLALDKLFSQDLFDFTARLGLTGDHWDSAGTKAVFETRGRFRQALTAPYLRAYWHSLTLPPPDSQANNDSKRLVRAVRNYWSAAKPAKYLETFLAARVQSLRWLEERMMPYNKAISKPAVSLAGLRDFSLDVTGVAGASLDFLRLDHHIKLSDWISAHLASPAARVAFGRSLPLTDVHVDGPDRVVAHIDAARADRTLSELRECVEIGEGSFVRLTPADADMERGQTIRQLLFGGKTATVESIDWEKGSICLATQFGRGGTYMLSSSSVRSDWEGFDFATLDESPSDFVAGVVERRLRDKKDSPLCAWFDPLNPRIPPQTPLGEEESQQLAQLAASSFIHFDEQEMPLAPDQYAACLEGLASRVQLLQGPPGTGKTQTTAAAVLLRILARLVPGDVVLLAANTHSAVDTLLERLDSLQDGFAAQAAVLGLDMPALSLAKIQPRTPPSGRVGSVKIKGSKSYLKKQTGVLVLGGTTNGVLKLAQELDGSAAYPDGFRSKILVVDEASMMVFPHLLAVATTLASSGELMLAGDHRQLSPIVAHNWESEDRAPIVAYTPFSSAYEAIRALADSGRLDSACITRTALSYSFRLPAEIRRLIGSVYLRDDIALQGADKAPASVQRQGGLQGIWATGGVFLIIHDEHSSGRANELEAELARLVLNASGAQQPGSIGIVTPHRAQRALLKERLQAFYGDSVDVIDTVERLQGGERETILVSACASDPAAISARAEFLLNLNRANVAFSRAKKRLIVIVAETLLDYVPSDLELYESGLLWKALRAQCVHSLGEISVSGNTARIFTA